MARSKRSASKEELWRLLVQEQRRCGLSVRAFCRREAVSEPSFYAWRKKLHKRDTERIADAGGNGRLIPVDVIRSTCEEATLNHHGVNVPLEICTPDGFTLRFDRDTTPETIARLLDVISRCATPGATSC